VTFSAAGWKEANLGDICTFKYGKSLPQTNRNGGEFLVYGSNGMVGHHDSAITTGKTIVIGRKGSYGEINYSTGPCWPIDTAYFVDETSTQHDIKWLFYRLAGLGLNQLNKAAAVPGLNREDAYRQRLLVPPLVEQRRIAAILDQADAIRAKRREALAQLDSLTHSIFIEVFGDPLTNPKNWPLCRLDSLFSATPIFGTLIPGGGRGSHLCLRVANIQNWQLDLSDQKFVDLPTPALGRHSVKDGDLLLARAIATQELLGKCIVARPGKNQWAFDSHLMRLRFRSDQVEPDFIRQALRTSGGRSIFLARSRKSTVQYNINTKEIAALQLPIPPLNLQQDFLKSLQAIDSLKVAHNDALFHSDTLFASLQHRAFQGEL